MLQIQSFCGCAGERDHVGDTTLPIKQHEIQLRGMEDRETRRGLTSSAGLRVKGTDRSRAMCGWNAPHAVPMMVWVEFGDADKTVPNAFKLKTDGQKSHVPHDDRHQDRINRRSDL